jgi:Fic-DOC domain mobile mystery protein B
MERVMTFSAPVPGETPIDPSNLKVRGITTREQLYEFEWRNIRKVVVKYLNTKPIRRSARFDYSWSLRLHREMFGEVWTWAGLLRTKDLNIGVPWQHVETNLFTLFGNLDYWEKERTVDLLEQAVMLHFEAVRIHPFENGNGRWSRMLANIWLKLHDHPYTSWPEEMMGQSSVIREEYLSAVRQADAGDYAMLRELHQRYTLP